jgi:hypothetical protein
MLDVTFPRQWIVMLRSSGLWLRAFWYVDLKFWKQSAASRIQKVLLRRWCPSVTARHHIPVILTSQFCVFLILILHLFPDALRWICCITLNIIITANYRMRKMCRDEIMTYYKDSNAIFGCNKTTKTMGLIRYPLRLSLWPPKYELERESLSRDVRKYIGPSFWKPLHSK